MHITSILLYLTWPALILITFWLVKIALNRYEEIQKNGEPETGNTGNMGN